MGYSKANIGNLVPIKVFQVRQSVVGVYAIEIFNSNIDIRVAVVPEVHINSRLLGS